METYIATNIYPVLFAAIKLGGVPLLIATFISFVIAIFQAVTSIQDQNLPQTVKISVLVFVLISMVGTLSTPLHSETLRILNNFNDYTF